MKPAAAFLGVLILIVVAVFGWGSGCYNAFVQSREHMRESWAQVENVLQRRYDLIPNLVNTVKGYAAHEQKLFEEVTRLRSQWGAAANVPQKVEAAQQLEGALSRLLVVMERYPELKANQNFLSLQDELAGTENRISVERKRYNETVRAYNISVQRFPANLVARMTGFAPSSAYFESAAEAKTAPKVQF